MTPPRVLVVGAGAAGGAVAVHLARLGAEVTVVESRAFPRVKVCGEFVSPAATRHLESVLPPERLRAAGARTCGVFVLEVAGGARGADRRLERAMGAPAWALSRASLDTLLLEEARAAGVRVLQPASVARVEYHDAGVRATLADGATLRAECVIHADGSGRHDPAGPTAHAPGLVGLKCHFEARALLRGEAAARGEAEGQTRGGARGAVRDEPEPGLTGVRIRACDGAYVGTIVVEGGRATCALVARAELVRRFAGDHDAMLASLWPRWPADGTARAGVGDAGVWKACPVSRSWPVRPGHPRSLRLGNACAAVDPIGGEGIGLALWSAHTLAELIARDARGVDALRETHALAGLGAGMHARYRARLRTRLPACRAAAWALMRPGLVRAAWPVLGLPGVGIAPWLALTGKPLARV